MVKEDQIVSIGAFFEHLIGIDNDYFPVKDGKYDLSEFEIAIKRFLKSFEDPISFFNIVIRVGHPELFKRASVSDKLDPKFIANVFFLSGLETDSEFFPEFLDQDAHRSFVIGRDIRNRINYLDAAIASLEESFQNSNVRPLSNQVNYINILQQISGLDQNQYTTWLNQSVIKSDQGDGFFPRQEIFEELQFKALTLFQDTQDISQGGIDQFRTELAFYRQLTFADYVEMFGIESDSPSTFEVLPFKPRVDRRQPQQSRGKMIPPPTA